MFEIIPQKYCLFCEANSLPGVEAHKAECPFRALKLLSIPDVGIDALDRFLVSRFFVSGNRLRKRLLERVGVNTTPVALVPRHDRRK
jgi:hypothetical protein